MDKKWRKKALADYLHWEENDQGMVERIKELLADIEKHPFTGLGKPEPLK
jgi:toxin YoeB